MVIVKGHEFDFDHNGKTYHAVVDFTLEIDKNYGADADGNRYIESAFLADLNVISILNEKDIEMVDDAELRQAAETVIENDELLDYL